MGRQRRGGHGTYQKGLILSFTGELDETILQMPAVDYRRPGQLRDGDVLVVRTANSGAEIALDLAKTHRVWLAGRHPGHMPFDLDNWTGRHLLMPMVMAGFQHRLTSVDNPWRARPEPD